MELELVVKVAKFCNLRCAYCYETPWLGDSRSMHSAQISTLYDRIIELITLVGDRKNSVVFYWQGGEPMLLPVTFWTDVYELQSGLRALKSVTLRNEIQTNATRLTDAHVDMLRSRYSVGISYDVVNDHRLTAGGQETDKAVIAGVAKLQAAGVEISGGIAVVSTANIDHPEEVARFFLGMGLGFRLLNIYTARNTLPNVAAVAVGWDDYLHFCQHVSDTPGIREAMANGLSVEPFASALKMRQSASKHGTVTPSDGSREWVLLVDTNGDLYSAGDAYNQTYRYGNIFSDSLETLFRSEGRKKRIERAKERINRICATGCDLFGRGCDGAYVGQCTPEEEEAFSRSGRCYFSALGLSERQTQCMSA